MVKKTTPSVKAKADIDFEKELWDAGNELCGALAENHFSLFDDTYHHWRNSGGGDTGAEDLCKAASRAEVESRGYVLSPRTYAVSEAKLGVPFEKKMKALCEELAKQFEVCRCAGDMGREEPGEIGFSQ